MRARTRVLSRFQLDLPTGPFMHACKAQLRMPIPLTCVGVHAHVGFRAANQAEIFEDDNIAGVKVDGHVVELAKGGGAGA
jgi:hypothetical protein